MLDMTLLFFHASKKIKPARPHVDCDVEEHESVPYQQDQDGKVQPNKLVQFSVEQTAPTSQNIPRKQRISSLVSKLGTDG